MTQPLLHVLVLIWLMLDIRNGTAISIYLDIPWYVGYPFALSDAYLSPMLSVRFFWQNCLGMACSINGGSSFFHVLVLGCRSIDVSSNASNFAFLLTDLGR
ncbi:hypothetical protein F5Y10DRAFT_254083 [Nemania abortiva]|nr:hypothetical protein F5Y10DRAFT_254083 [Nemania abortiva]